MARPCIDGKLCEDPLTVTTLPEKCPECEGNRNRRRTCDVCEQTGRPLARIQGLWSGSAGFLVCGGASLREIPVERLRDRGIVSMGVNNVAGYVPVTAWTFGDHQRKFHPGVIADPKVMLFCPLGKLSRHMRMKLPDGTFRSTNVRIGHCPSVFGIARSGQFHPETFFKTKYAQWGKSKHEKYVLATMLVGLRLLHYLGVTRVYMLGVDFDRADKDDGYAFRERGSGGMRKYVKCNGMLKELHPAMEEAGFEVFNCNPKSRCDAFEYRTFEDAYQDCRGVVPNEPFDLEFWYSERVAKEMLERFPGVVDDEFMRRVAREGGMPKGDGSRKALEMLKEFEKKGDRCAACGGKPMEHVPGCLVGGLISVLGG